MTTIYYKLVYTWKYEPKDLFQGKHNLKLDSYTITFSEGKITAEVYNTTAKGHHLIIRDHVENYFKAASIISGLGYTIDKDPTIVAFDEKGEKLPVQFVNIPIETVKMHEYRIIAFKEEEKQLIIEEEKMLGEFFAKYYHAEDPIIRFIYESYKASLTEERFLVNLYDIMEAICTFLNFIKDKKKNLKKVLSLEDIDLKIYDLANNEIKQGRHPGNLYKKVRDITPSEKAEVMAAIKKIILAFFERIWNNSKLIEKLNHQ